jgi:hypothetical protein
LAAIRSPFEKVMNGPLAARAAMLAGLGLVCATALVFQDDLVRFSLAPRAPFQTTTPPPAPQYGARGAWAYWPDALGLERGAEAAADIFYVHSTTWYSARGWNAPIGKEDADAELRRNAAPNEVGPFAALGPLYAPRYRQATLFAFFTHKFDGVAARRLAYDDVRNAFSEYLKSSEADRPLVLVGYGQGGLHVLGLLADFFQDDIKLRRRLAVAYVIDQATPLRLFNDRLAETPPCARPTDIRCVVSYVDYEERFAGEIDRTRRRSMVWTADGGLTSTANSRLLCTNPLTFAVNEERADAAEHAGAASATGLAFGATPPSLPRLIGAQCVDGVLIVDTPRQAFLRRNAAFGAKWKARSYNLFFFDLAEDAAQRAARAAEAMIRLDPISESVDLRPSPINKVPD